MTDALTLPQSADELRPNVARRELVIAFVLTALFVLVTRLPFARPEPMEWDEFGYIVMITENALPMHHTLFLALARIIGNVLGEPYRGFVVLDMAMSAVALVSVWWWLRALVRPSIAAGTTFLLAVSPTVWTYGAMAGNYTGIIAVGSFLLGILVRTWDNPRAWHPYAAAVALAFGTGYRQDIGTFWTPILALVLWRHRWKTAIFAGLLFVVLNLAWLVAMLSDVGWAHYRAKSQEFAHTAGYMNSAFYLGFRDATARYIVKLGLAVVWTFGPALLLVPTGLWRVVKSRANWRLAAIMLLSVLPALAFHLIIHFGVPGYIFHYVPALIALVAIGLGGLGTSPQSTTSRPMLRLGALATISAFVFLAYTPDYTRDGVRASFDLSVGRCSRVGLVLRTPDKLPNVWRTANSASVKRPLPHYTDGRIVPATPLN